jgi:hypothetical protein
MMPLMKRTMSKWGFVAVLTLLGVLVPATSALARDDPADREVVDARLEGYSNTLSLPKGSEGLTWVAMVFLGVLCCGGLFKDAKRTHLD